MKLFIKEWCEVLGKSIRALAQETGLSYRSMMYFNRGETNLRLGSLISISKSLDVPVYDLYDSGLNGLGLRCIRRQYGYILTIPEGKSLRIIHTNIPVLCDTQTSPIVTRSSLDLVLLKLDSVHRSVMNNLIREPRNVFNMGREYPMFGHTADGDVYEADTYNNLVIWFREVKCVSEGFVSETAEPVLIKSDYPDVTSSEYSAVYKIEL